ncbi:MAG: MFS transporter [Pseudomonadota bacterium]
MAEVLLPPRDLLVKRVGIGALFAHNGAVIGFWASRIPQISERHGLSEAHLGLLLLLIALGAILSFGFAGRASDRFGAAGLSMLLACLGTAFLIGIALAPNVAVLAVALAGLGASLGGMDVSMNAWAAQVDARSRREAMPVFHALWSLGAGLAAATGAVTLSLEWSALAHFAILGVLSLGVALALAGVAGGLSVQHRSVQTQQSERFALPPKALVWLGAMAALAALGEGAMIDWSALFLVEAIDAPQDEAALGLTVFSVAMVATRLSGPLLLERLGAQPAAIGSGFVAAFGVALALMSTNLTGALLGFVAMGMGYALIFPLAMSQAAKYPDLPPGRAIAAAATLGYSGILVGPVLIGFLAHATSLQGAFGLLISLALLTSVLAWRARFEP